MDMDNLYCLPKELREIKLGGNFDLGEYRALKIDVHRCPVSSLLLPNRHPGIEPG